MPRLPDRPVSGQRIEPEWFGRLWDTVHELSDRVTLLRGARGGGARASVPVTPFAGGVYDASTVQVGYLREQTGYPHVDTILVLRPGGDFAEITKASAETVGSISATSWVYYLVTQTGGTYSATLTAATSLPSDDSNGYVVIVGKAIVSDGGDLAGWRQYLFGCPVIDLRPKLTGGALITVSEDDSGTNEATVISFDFTKATSYNGSGNQALGHLAGTVQALDIESCTTTTTTTTTTGA